MGFPAAPREGLSFHLARYGACVSWRATALFEGRDTTRARLNQPHYLFTLGRGCIACVSRVICSYFVRGRAARKFFLPRAFFAAALSSLCASVSLRGWVLARLLALGCGLFFPALCADGFFTDDFKFFVNC